MRKIPIKSRYFDQIKLPNSETSMGQSMRESCSFPHYGNLHYDKYRQVYYRIAYPPTEFDEGDSPIEMYQYGRKRFSMIILNKEFDKIGEVLFPDNNYVSIGLFINKEGLYISASHYKNPEFDDDLLRFERFELKPDSTPLSGC